MTTRAPAVLTKVVMYLKLLEATSSTAGSGGGAELFGRKDLARHSQRQGRGAWSNI